MEDYFCKWLLLHGYCMSKNGNTLNYSQQYNDWWRSVTSILICWIRERSTTMFISDWKPFMDFLMEKRKMNLWFIGFEIRKGSLWKEGSNNVALEGGQSKNFITVKKIRSISIIIFLFFLFSLLWYIFY